MEIESNYLVLQSIAGSNERIFHVSPGVYKCCLHSLSELTKLIMTNGLFPYRVTNIEIDYSTDTMVVAIEEQPFKLG